MYNTHPLNIYIYNAFDESQVDISLYISVLDAILN